jgi:hypothetical protein
LAVQLEEVERQEAHITADAVALLKTVWIPLVAVTVTGFPVEHRGLDGPGDRPEP